MTLAAVGALAQVSSVTETVSGDLTRVSVRLLWQYIVPESERVIRGGVPQRPGAQYDFQADYGVIRFLPPLRPGESVEVTYSIRMGYSRKPSAVSLAPLEADFFSYGPARLGVLANVRGDAAGYVGLRADLAPSRGWSLTGQYLVNSAEEAGPDGSMVRLGAEGSLLGGTFTAKLDSAGAGFREAKTLGARAGQDVLDAEWRSGEGPTTGHLSYHEEGSPGGGRSTASGGFESNLSDRLTLFGSRSTTTLGGRARTRDEAGLDYALNDAAMVGVDWFGEMGRGGATRLRFAAADPFASISASHTMPDGSGETATDVEGSVRVGGSLSVETAAHEERGAGMTDTKVRWNAAGSFSLAATYLTSDDSLYSEASGVEMRWAPARYFEVSGAGRRRLVEETGDPLDTVSVQVRLTPFRALSLTGAYADRPESKLGVPLPQAQRSVGAQLSVGSFWVGGAYTQNEALDTEQLAQNYKLESGLKFARNTSLTVSYGRDSLFETGTSETRYYGLGFQHQAGVWRLSLEGRLRDAYENGLPQSDRRDYEARMSLGLGF